MPDTRRLQMIEVELEQRIYSDVPQMIGIWSITRRVQLAAVPRSSDWVEPAKGWASCPVRDVTFVADGPPIVTLEPLKTDDPERLTETERLVTKHGWTQVGGPWKDQGAPDA